MQVAEDRKTIPDFLALRQRLHLSMIDKLKRFQDINIKLYTLARAPVAIVPFGLQAANFVDMLRLVRSVLAAVGMADDAAVDSTVADGGRPALLPGAIVGAITDVYTFMSGGTVTLSLTTAVLAGDGLATAMAGLAIMDPVIVGAISLVAGAVSAVSAAKARPQLIESLAQLAATMQALWAVQPDLRRSPAVRTPAPHLPAAAATLPLLNERRSAGRPWGQRASECAVVGRHQAQHV